MTTKLVQRYSINQRLNDCLPQGVNVIISSDTVTVTNQTVDIGTAEGEESGSGSGGGSDEGSGSGGGSDDEEAIEE